MYFDPTYLLFVGPALLLSLWASWRTRSAFKKYSKVMSLRGLTGAQAAAEMLRAAGISDVNIVPHAGSLSDHYDPSSKTLALSEPVYGQRSIAAIGVACHEAGHAIQHATHYGPLGLRSALVPTAGIGSNVGYMVMFGGLIFHLPKIVVLGALIFSAVLLFQIVTLPVEFDASARAKKLAVENGLILPQEREGMDRVLNAAAMTYVAAVVSSLMTVLYYLVRAGVLGGGSRRA
ncbi:MAG TPA: zinc metallopeptidase [Thermoanaerobaculia bacterium]|jgi:Zn-dependent membrane protease YugP|nr:zinc metallopeptidase [Thermoanaerobaculia bacterium]